MTSFKSSSLGSGIRFSSDDRGRDLSPLCPQLQHTAQPGAGYCLGVSTQHIPLLCAGPQDISAPVIFPALLLVYVAICGFWSSLQLILSLLQVWGKCFAAFFVFMRGETGAEIPYILLFHHICSCGGLDHFLLFHSYVGMYFAARSEMV